MTLIGRPKKSLSLSLSLSLVVVSILLRTKSFVVCVLWGSPLLFVFFWTKESSKKQRGKKWSDEFNNGLFF